MLYGITIQIDEITTAKCKIYGFWCRGVAVSIYSDIWGGLGGGRRQLYFYLVRAPDPLGTEFPDRTIVTKEG